jgi:hypothetical protein
MNLGVIKSIYLSVSCLFLVYGCSSHSVHESTITAQEFDKTIMLTVPASKVKLTIPKLELVKQSPSNSPSNRYFLYWDTNSQLGISGWFEHQSLFKGAKFHWKEYTAKLNGNQPTNVSFEKLNGWEIVRYNINVQGCSQSNVKAFLVKNETWLDIHVSSFCNGSKPQADILGYLKNITVENKT